jgi:hypothetical protein
VTTSILGDTAAASLLPVAIALLISTASSSGLFDDPAAELMSGVDACPGRVSVTSACLLACSKNVKTEGESRRRQLEVEVVKQARLARGSGVVCHTVPKTLDVDSHATFMVGSGVD